MSPPTEPRGCSVPAGTPPAAPETTGPSGPGTGTGGSDDASTATGRARALGWRAGVAAGTWQDHIGDKDTATRCLRWFDDGDPAWELTFGYRGPAPLSGQDPDAPTLESLLHELDLGPDPGPELVEDIRNEYTDGFADGYQDHVCGAALAVVAVWVYTRLTADAPIGRADRDTAAAYVDQIRYLESQQDTGHQDTGRQNTGGRDQLVRRLAILLPAAVLQDD